MTSPAAARKGGGGGGGGVGEVIKVLKYVYFYQAPMSYSDYQKAKTNFRFQRFVDSFAYLSKNGACALVIVHTILRRSPVILWIKLGSKPKWLQWNFG